MKPASVVRSLLGAGALWGLTGSVCAPSVLGGETDLADIRLPEGFRIAVYAEGVDNARAMCLGDRGTLFVGSRGAGVIHALQDTDGDHVADVHHIVADGLKMPVGVAFRDGDLYVSAVDRILRLPAIEDRLTDPPAPEVVYDGFPDETHHGWKFIAFGPDGKLYVPVGAPCNTCEPDDPIYCSITRLDVKAPDPEIVARGVRNSVGFDWDPRTGDLWFTDNGRDWLGDDSPPCELDHLTSVGQHFGYPYCHGGTIADPEIVARGVRNSVGFDWDPRTGDLWFTDNGRDWLGDDSPPCELDHLTSAGQHFGYPYCHAGTIADPEFGQGRSCQEFVPPARALGPHVAPLGMRFYRGDRFPEDYRNAIFIAEHGSWNRSTPIGYRVMVVRDDGSGGLTYEPFAEGWLKGGRASGRPVDVLEMPDGALLVSDDAADRIYRISYEAPR